MVNYVAPTCEAKNMLVACYCKLPLPFEVCEKNQTVRYRTQTAELLSCINDFLIRLHGFSLRKFCIRNLLLRRLAVFPPNNETSRLTCRRLSRSTPFLRPNHKPALNLSYNSYNRRYICSIHICISNAWSV